MQEQVGRVVGGRFRIVRLIGEGGMGAVYEAKHETLPRKFAIKILKPELARDRNFIERFRREAIASSRVEHPNVIYITDFGSTEDGSVYLVMEYLEGIGLDEVLNRLGRIPVHRSLPILMQTADALDYAHRMNVVHRDLKPENILLTETRGQQDVVKLLDFGIAKMLEPEFDKRALTMQGQVFGTAEYMSPEQAAGEPLDGRSDLYALGCLAYEMLTGEPPFLGQPLEILRAHVEQIPLAPSTKLKSHTIPPALDALVLRCLAKNPAERYQTGAEVRRDLLKVRAILLGQLPSSLGSRAAGEDASPRQMANGWHNLGDPALSPPGEVPELLSDELASAQGMASRQDVDPEQLRAEYRDVLRELALALVQAALSPPETSEMLERLLLAEEEIAAQTGTLALAEQSFDRIRFDYSQREKRLRYAVLDLSMEQAKLRGLAAADPTAQAQLQPQIEDLAFQIGALDRRCRELEGECEEQIRELGAEVKRDRQQQKTLEAETARLFQELRAQVEALRSLAVTDALRELYAALDRLGSSLDGGRAVGAAR